MKVAAIVVSAGLSASALGQDVLIAVDITGGTMEAIYVGALPLQQMFSSIAVRISGNGPITITSQSNVYTSVLSPGGAAISGNGTNVVEFVGEAPGALLGAPVDSSNPFSPFTFSYGGTLDGFSLAFFSQTTVTFVQPPFGNPINMVNADGSLGPLTFAVVPPAPGTAALLGFAGVVGARRRR